MPPDRAVWEADLKSPAFRMGEIDGRWRHIETSWPTAVIAVTAAARERSPAEFWIRFECSGYRARAVTGQLWDGRSGAGLAAALWPQGRSIVPSVFRPTWRNGTCLYLPCDRLSFEGHPNWVTQHAERLWNPARGIICYLEQLYEILNSSDYTGALCPAA
jgi:hypothetical protein